MAEKISEILESASEERAFMKGEETHTAVYIEKPLAMQRGALEQKARPLL